MEQARGENKPQQQEQPPAPLRCPRCNSLDTKFRYYNNHSHEQPRHYCKTCKRQWTVGGSLRNIPFGGNHRNPKQTKASSSRCGNPTSQPPPPQSPSEEQQSQHLSQMATIIPQNFDITMIQPMSNPSAAISSSSLYFFNDEISCLAAIQSLIQPQEINQPLNVGNQFCNGSANMSSLHESNTQPMASRQALPQQIPGHIESYQTHNQNNNAVPHHLPNSSLVQPILPTNSFPRDFINDPSSSPSNIYFFSDNMPDMETDWSCVIPGEWPNFPSYSPS